jgi:NADH dehydrogenase [ubiquinone] 1 alpha subcomplex assembly factor 5
MSAAPRIFDRHLLRLRRLRLARREGEGFLQAEVAARLVDRVEDLRRPLPTTLLLGDPAALPALRGRFGIDTLVHAGLAADARPARQVPAVVADEELLPFAGGRLDAVLSPMALHWVNDLPGTLAQIAWCLKPDGVLLAAFPGGATLAELRHALTLAELELLGGAGARVSPFVDLADAAGLLMRAGFALPVADADRITVLYRDPLRLVIELRRMGEASALADRPGPLRRAVLARALELYRREHADRGGRVRATFEILFLCGWRPHGDQPRPRPRGSARASLADALRPRRAAGDGG